jgi:hypothetical protein
MVLIVGEALVDLARVRSGKAARIVLDVITEQVISDDVVDTNACILDPGIAAADAGCADDVSV